MNTPTPWVVRVNDDHYSDKDDVEICGNPDGSIGGSRVLGNFWHTYANAVDNANFVVRAVNSHQALVDALEPFAEEGADLTNAPCHRGLTTAENCGRCGKALRARAALKLARGEV